MDNKSELLSVALEAVKAAEAVIFKYLKTGFSTELKADLSPVTIADKEAEAIIRQTITEHFPDHTFFGEEGGTVSLENHRGYTWIIDPIDGTKNFVRRNPLFGTLLALMHDGELVIGITNMPLFNELMYAEKGQGAFLNDQPVRVTEITSLDDAYLSHGSLKYFVELDQASTLLKLASEVRQARGIGDVWSYHLLAQGKIDIMIEPKCKLWDIAASKVIVEEAGGKMTQLDGQPIGAHTTSAVATNGKLHATIVNQFGSSTAFS